MKKTTAILLSLLTLVTLFSTTTTTGNNNNNNNNNNMEIKALLEFKSALTDPLNSLVTWQNATSLAPCDWRGISCNVGSVTQVRLPNLGLSGPVSPSLANLTKLEKLSLRNNYFISGIPLSLSKLSLLTAVYLNDNRFSGEVPNGLFFSLKNLQILDLARNSLAGEIFSGDSPARLRYLDLSNNLFSGKAPANFSLSGELRYLDLSDNRFSGEIPASLAVSGELRYLDLSDNRFSGEIPASIGDLQALEFLNIENNEIFGTIPSALSNCSGLVHVIAGGNMLRGVIPATMGELPRLETLSLSRNRVSGYLPDSLLFKVFNKTSNLRVVELGLNSLTGMLGVNVEKFSSNLQVLDIHGNNIESAFPVWLTEITTLTYLDISNNLFSGNLPSEIGNLINLQDLRVANNSLSGDLPVEINKCRLLKVLDLENNGFSGLIPIHSGDFKKLNTLSLGKNLFSGPVPLGLVTLYELEALNLGSNNLSGPIPEKLMGLSNLSSLDLGNNKFSGEFPSNIGSLRGLRVLNMSGCGFSGEVPNGIGSLLRLNSLDLSKQNLSGELPFELFGLPNLEIVALDDNKLSGAVPEGFSSLSNLRFLNLSSNNFTNEIPVTYGFLQSLKVLSLSRNSIVGSIPTDFGNCSSLENLELRANNLTGDIPKSLSRLENIRELDLGENGLTGTIPESISSCSSLVSLLLDSNQLSGSIPDTLSKLSNLTKLDLSLNKLSGDIPLSLATLNSLSSLNLSSNTLKGEIPEKLASKFADPLVFAMNKDLCGRPLSNNCKTRENVKKQKMVLFLAVAIAGSIIVGLCCCGYLIAFFCWQKKLREGKNGEKKKSPRTSSGTESEGNRGPKLIMFNDKITYEETVEATRNFDEENVLSRGKYGVLFKATYSDGMVLSIRQLPDAAEVAGFKREAESLGDVKHKNLTVLRGYFAGLPDVRLLIYDYMPNGNLATLLQEASHQDGHILNWPMRHLIALGIARGLAFLHSVNIFHGDVNPQNVLFDADFEAHLSDFGLEKLTMVKDTTRTIGYVAPEVSLTGQTTKETDIYSFGIVLLEILTGRKPVMFSEDENIVKWVKKQLQSGQIMELLEPGLLDLDPESSEWEEFLLGVKVGLLCTTPDPTERPTMTDVVFMLEGCRVGPDMTSSADPTTLTSPM